MIFSVFQLYKGGFLTRSTVLTEIVVSLYYSDEKRPEIILTSSKIFFTDQYIRGATNGKYGVIDLYEERLPVSSDTEPPSPAFSDESDQFRRLWNNLVDGSSIDQKIISNWFYGINHYRLFLFAISVQRFTIHRKLLIINIITGLFHFILIILKFQYYCLFGIINKSNEVFRNFIENSFKAPKFVVNNSELLFQIITRIKSKFVQKQHPNKKTLITKHLLSLHIYEVNVHVQWQSNYYRILFCSHVF